MPPRVARREPRRGAARREKKMVPVGAVHIQSTFNNTIITITDPQGNTVTWSSAGLAGFKGSRKSTPFAAGLAATQAGKSAMDIGMREVAAFAKEAFQAHGAT
ncbi:MAG: 30S ribosomal protein S11, partial [Anaerolineae bacterium]